MINAFIMGKKILLVVGARPQFIKVAPLLKVIHKKKDYRGILVHTGQHYDADMSQVFFDELEIAHPRYNLGVGSGGHGKQTGEMLKRLEPIMISEKPDFVIIFGDTNSTLAGALVASKLHIPIAHVEAGLRSFNRKMPEELNRVVADHLSSLLFCPTETAVTNLKNEGICRNVFHTGDIMYDAALQFVKKAKAKSSVLSALHLSPKGYILATVHRAENTDNKERLFNILSALAMLAEDSRIVFPMHPRTRKMIDSFKFNRLLKNVLATEPAGFLNMISLESNAKLIMTDSGGVQKEAYFYRVPCVTLREETEWVETVRAGWNIVGGNAASDVLVDFARHMLLPHPKRGEIEEYGDGKAAEKIIANLCSKEVVSI
jgi:UDP-GlcNAc3NAcA epimerase